MLDNQVCIGDLYRIGSALVTLAPSGVTATWDPACESILDLAECQGLSLDYS